MDEDVVVIGPKKPSRPKKLYKCTKCSYTTNRAYNVQRHLPKHDKKPPKELQHMCPYSSCSFTSLRWDNMTRHIQGIHREEEPPVQKRQKPQTTIEILPCPEEPDSTPTYDDPPISEDGDPECSEDDNEIYLEDQYEEIIDEDQKSSDEIITAQPAEKLSTSKPNQIEKASKNHKQNISNPKKSPIKTKSKIYKCNTCEYSTNRGFNIKRHLLKHMVSSSKEVLLHVCIISGCQFSTPRWDNLCRHVSRIHPGSSLPEPDR